MNNGNVRLKEYEMFTVTSCEYKKEIDDYGCAKIQGYVANEDYNSFKAKAKLEDCFFIEEVIDSKIETIFSGILDSISYKADKGIYYITIKLEGMLKKLNRVNYTRIFQDSENSLDSIISLISKEIKIECKVRSTYSKIIPHMVVQYQETDWSFIKRIVNEIGGCIVPEYKNSSCRMYVGVNNDLGIYINSEKYLLNSLYEEYENKKANGMSVYADDSYEYIVKESMNMELGDKVYLNGKCLYVYRVEGKWEGSEINHYYTLREKRAFVSLAEKNYDLCGACFTARVKSINHDKIEVSYEDVEAYGGCEYAYATVYSSVNGAGWYCMPEIGDKVTINFASFEPNSAYASGSVHLEMGTQDPNTKFIKNTYGKEIRFTKDSLTITNNSGTEIVLSDQDGLILSSAGNIVLEAEKEISISSLNERVTLQGETGVELSQGDSKVIVNGDVKLVGQQVHIQNLE